MSVKSRALVKIIGKNRPLCICSSQCSLSKRSQLFDCIKIVILVSLIHLSFTKDLINIETPTIEPLTSTNALAVADRIEGTVLVLPFNTTDLVLRVLLDSNTCPNIQWQFNGENVTTTNTAFSFNDPCADDNNFSPYDFNFTIANLTSATSGSYSALFNNEFSTVVYLPAFYVTIPGITAVSHVCS